MCNNLFLESDYRDGSWEQSRRCDCDVSIAFFTSVGQTCGLKFKLMQIKSQKNRKCKLITLRMEVPTLVCHGALLAMFVDTSVSI